MAWIALHDFVDGELVAARYYRDLADDADYLKGAQDGQEVIDLGFASLQVAADIGAQASAAQLEILCMPDDSFGSLAFSGYKASSLSSGDAVEIRFALRDPAGPTIEDLARIRFYKDASAAARGGIELGVASGGSFVSPPPIGIGFNGRIGIFKSSPGYGCDITGDCNATSYEGLTTWGESPAGTAYHPGDAIVTKQWKSTVSTGTAPLVAQEGAPLNQNLNADALQGLSWPGTPTTATGSNTIATKNVSYTVASVSAPSAGLYQITGEASFTVAASDAGASFEAMVTGAPRWSPCSESVSTGVSQLSSGSFYRATNGETLSLLVRKTSGTGSSTAAGSIQTQKIAP